MRNNKGIVLPATLAFMLAFTMLGFGSLYLATQQNEAADRRIFSEKAFWLAEAGIQKAMWKLKYNDSGGLTFQPNGDKKYTSEAGEMGDYSQYSFILNAADSIVTSTGSYTYFDPGLKYSRRTIQLSSQSPFNYAIFSDEKIKLFNKATIDSYNSKLGDYGSSNHASNGDIGSNISATKNNDDPVAMTLQNYGGAPFEVVKGNVSTGPGGTISWPGLKDDEIAKTVTGEISHQNNVELPAVIVPSSLKALSSKGDLDIPDYSEHKLKTGEYKYASIGMNHKAKLVIEGNVKIYLTKSGNNALKIWDSSEVVIKSNSSLILYTDGEITMHKGASIRNLDRKPSKLTIYSTYSSDAMGMNLWSGDNDAKDNIDRNFYGSIYAPETRISIHNDKEVFGSFVGKDFYVDGGKLHYDEFLRKELVNGDNKWSEVTVLAP